MSTPKELVESLKPFYDRGIYDPEELLEDIARLVSVGRSLIKWKRGKPLNPRLVINNMVIFFNVFGPRIDIIMAFSERGGFGEQMTTLLVFLRRLDRTKHKIDIDLYECLLSGIQN